MSAGRQQTLFDFIGNLHTLGAHLRLLREAEDPDLTVAGVARQLGRDPAWYAGVEAGEVEPTLHDLHNIGHVLGVVFQVGFRPMDIIHNPDEIPAFASEREEAEWWCTHDFSDEIWAQARRQPGPVWLPPVRQTQGESRHE